MIDDDAPEYKYHRGGQVITYIRNCRATSVHTYAVLICSHGLPMLESDWWPWRCTRQNGQLGSRARGTDASSRRGGLTCGSCSSRFRRDAKQSSGSSVAADCNKLSWLIANMALKVSIRCHRESDPRLDCPTHNVGTDNSLACAVVHSEVPYKYMMQCFLLLDELIEWNALWNMLLTFCGLWQQVGLSFVVTLGLLALDAVLGAKGLKDDPTVAIILFYTRFTAYPLIHLWPHLNPSGEILHILVCCEGHSALRRYSRQTCCRCGDLRCELEWGK